MFYFRVLVISSLALLLKTSTEVELIKTVPVFRSLEAEGTLCGGGSTLKEVKLIALSSAIRVSFSAFYKHCT